MPSTDIDGSIIVILSEAEAYRVYECLMDSTDLIAIDRQLMKKIEHTLNLEDTHDSHPSKT